ncbi:N,N-dimethylformamidase beta subunit family domain-containing protein [Devosia sp.]|uniref:N,N-dimethylformamidase beta subunit family domain-containing protein n=1 Tax=Devosia sp. TaxID=1871048 RepID=UPI003BA9E089
MRRKVEHRALAIAGYVEPWTGTEPLRQLSMSASAETTSVSIRRLDRDGMPRMDWPVQKLSAVAHREFSQGAFAEISKFESLGAIRSLRFELLLTENAGQRVLLDCRSFSLWIEDNQLSLRQDDVQTWLAHVPAKQWLDLVIDWSEREVSINAIDDMRPYSISAPFEAPAPNCFCLLSDTDEAFPTLNCRMAKPHLAGERGNAAWNFPTLFTAEPLSAAGVELKLHGNPTFCVTSARWDGSVLDPRLDAAHYDAIHFHDTDMAGLDWPASYEVLVPETAESGAYAFELVADGVTERIAFFVAPRVATAAVLFIVPTSTYLAYADEYLPPHLYEWFGTDRGHVFARDNQLRSLYDYHSDQSGVSLVSSRRPKATLRDDYRYPLCGDPHNLPVDLHFLRFCARHGIAVDVATDAELHAEGLALLSPYRCVVTGSHPEYLSVRMEQAYRDYVSQSGDLAYLGGNGFAATVAYRDDLMELRRGPTQAGRTWDGPLAEMGLALTNEPGGYLRDRGRGEYSLVGVGISLMGFSPGRPYVRTARSHEDDLGWLFDGVSESFGDSGIVLGAAAGYEVDAVNYHLGSPEDIIILATASGFPDAYVDDSNRWFEGGEAERRAHRRADMTLWRHSRGGSVFSASSVAFLGALPGEGGDNDVGRLTLNLLRHFSK